MLLVSTINHFFYTLHECILYGDFYIFTADTVPITDPPSSNVPVVWVVAACGILVVITIVVIVVVSRKRVRGFTWFPEGFFHHQESSKPVSRRGPDGEEMK